MTELRLIRNFYADGSPLIYRVHGKMHPEFGRAYNGNVWVQALTGDIAGTWFNRLVDVHETPYTSAAGPTALAVGSQITRTPDAAVIILKWSNSKPRGYEMKEDEIL